MATVATMVWRQPASAVELASTQLATPHNPESAANYITARELWARRTPEDLNRSIILLRRVVSRDPTFAPAYAALADAWLLEMEFGAVDEATGFGAARRAAERAVLLDPELPSAHRALGFVAFWRDNRIDAAAAEFKRALARDNADAQTHFWYANVLADVGRDAAAQLEYDRAQLLAPESHSIAVERAYSQWLAGRDGQALHDLTELARQAPNDANLHLCLSWVYISHGDIAGYAREFAVLARLRGDSRLVGRAAELTAAVKRDRTRAISVLMRQERQAIAAAERNMRQSSAFFASSLGDRTELIALMTEAYSMHERWYSRSINERIARRWRGDADIHALLDRLRGSQ